MDDMSISLDATIETALGAVHRINGVHESLSKQALNLATKEEFIEDICNSVKRMGRF